MVEHKTNLPDAIGMSKVLMCLVLIRADMRLQPESNPHRRQNVAKRWQISSKYSGTMNTIIESITSRTRHGTVCLKLCLSVLGLRELGSSRRTKATSCRRRNVWKT